VLTVRATGKPADLTGSTATLTVDSLKEPADATTHQYQLTAAGPLTTDGKMKFSPTTLQANRVGYFFFEVKVTEISGAVRTVAAGTYNYVQDITK
jgi:hypothetical protein